MKVTRSILILIIVLNIIVIVIIMEGRDDVLPRKIQSHASYSWPNGIARKGRFRIVLEFHDVTHFTRCSLALRV